MRFGAFRSAAFSSRGHARAGILGGWRSRMSPHELWKTAHVLSAAVILGTGLGIAFFCWFGYRGALRSGDIGALRLLLRLTVIADAWFTGVAVAFQAASGLRLMDQLGWPLLSPWSIAVWSLFALAGA